MRESLIILTGALSGNPLPNGTVVTSGFNSFITSSTTTTSTVPSWVTDTSIPPAPTGFTVTGAFATIILNWTPASFTNYAYTEIWRASTNAIGAASLVGSTTGSQWSDAIGNNTTEYYWIRFVNKAGVIGPYNAPGGTVGTTAIDPAVVLASLTGQITTTQLYSSLATEINAIPGMQTSINTIQNTQTTQASSIATLQTTVSTQGASISTLQSTQTTQGNSIASLTTTVSSQGTSISTLNGQVSTNTASISTQATSISGLQAQYTVKVDVNGYVSGFGLASSPVNGTPYSTFIVRADSFSIGAPGSTTPAPTLPFVVQTSATTVNGVSRPAGTYIQDAFIANGTISNAKIGSLAVDDGKISSLSVTKLTAGSLSVGQYIQSSGYVANSSGWNINYDGTAQFQSLVARGTMSSNTFISGSSGWQIKNDGTAEFNSVTVRGNISGASNISITGQGFFAGKNTSSVGITVHNTSYTVEYAIQGNASTSPSTSLNARAGVQGISNVTGAQWNVGISGYGYRGSGETSVNGIGVAGAGDTFGGYFSDVDGDLRSIGLVANHTNDVGPAFAIGSGLFTYRGVTIQKPLATGTNYLRDDGQWVSISGSGGGTVTSVSGTGTVSGLTLSGTVTSSGSLTLGGSLSLTSSQVTTALGYTPYNSGGATVLTTSNYTSYSPSLSGGGAYGTWGINISGSAGSASVYTGSITQSQLIGSAPGGSYFLSGSGWTTVNVVSTLNGLKGDLTITSTFPGVGITSSGTNINFYQISDVSLKTNIQPIDLGLDFIRQLKPVTYNWNTPLMTFSKPMYGFIAQDVYTATGGKESSIVYTHADTEGPLKGLKAVGSEGIVAALTKAVQDLDATVTTLLAKVAALEAQLAKS
jgi:hypothetical protein